ncbi:MAG: PilZ domain-containing protein [Verrucomicrobiia bacterium]
MSARQFGNVNSFQQPITVEARQTRLELSSDAVVIHKSGVEFRSPVPFNLWTEMTVALQSRRDETPIQCSGVVIACSGNKHVGYHVSLLFTGMSKHAQSRLNSMAYSELGAA